MEPTARTRGTRFGAFEVDLRSGEVHKHGIRLKLQDQPFRVLALLLEHSGDVVTREELRQKLWPADTFVDFDTGLNSAIKKLRDVLGRPKNRVTSRLCPGAATALSETSRTVTWPHRTSSKRISLQFYRQGQLLKSGTIAAVSLRPLWRPCSLSLPSQPGAFFSLAPC